MHDHSYYINVTDISFTKMHDLVKVIRRGRRVESGLVLRIADWMKL